jgi:hypothetical protein
MGLIMWQLAAFQSDGSASLSDRFRPPRDMAFYSHVFGEKLLVDPRYDYLSDTLKYAIYSCLYENPYDRISLVELKAQINRNWEAARLAEKRNGLKEEEIWDPLYKPPEPVLN